MLGGHTIMDTSNNQSNTNPLVNSYTTANSSTIQASTARTNAMNTSNAQQGNQTIIGVFENRSNAEAAVASLRQQGFTKEEINIISKKQEHQDTNEDDDILDGTLTGSAIGGIGGLILGAGALVIPGIGPIIAAGPIAAAVGGAIAGGITGGLIDWGIPADESQHYEQEVIDGSILAIIRTNAGKVNSVAQILRQNGAKEVKNHSK
jgi:uncharacterized membrane protein